MYVIRRIANGKWSVLTPLYTIAFLNSFQEAISFVDIEIDYFLELTNDAY